MKLLLYCTKGKPYLVKSHKGFCLTSYKHPVNAKERYDAYFILSKEYNKDALNGTIPCECDFEVEEILANDVNLYDEYGIKYTTKNGYSCIDDNFEALLDDSCLNAFELNDYLGGYGGKAIHIKNLKVFKEPKKLNEFYYNAIKLEKAPHNMMIVQELVKSEKPIGTYFINGTFLIKDYILIPVHPKLLCKILNRECTIIIKKKVLKEMIK